MYRNKEQHCQLVKINKNYINVQANCSMYECEYMHVYKDTMWIQNDSRAEIYL